MRHVFKSIGIRLRQTNIINNNNRNNNNIFGKTFAIEIPKSLNASKLFRTCTAFKTPTTFDVAIVEVASYARESCLLIWFGNAGVCVCLYSKLQGIVSLMCRNWICLRCNTFESFSIKWSREWNVNFNDSMKFCCFFLHLNQFRVFKIKSQHFGIHQIDWATYSDSFTFCSIFFCIELNLFQYLKTNGKRKLLRWRISKNWKLSKLIWKTVQTSNRNRLYRIKSWLLLGKQFFSKIKSVGGV